MHTIFNEDCLLTMKKMKEGVIDLVVTSPPYDNLRDYHGYSFDFERVAKELYRVMVPGGVIVWVVNDATVKGSETGTSFRQALFFKEIGFNLHDTMIWKKTGFSNPGNNRYHNVWEFMFVFSKGNPKTFNPIKDRKNKYRTSFGIQSNRQVNGELISRGKRAEFGEWGMRTNVWEMNTVSQAMPCQRPPHPAMFPEELVEGHVLSWSNENDLIYDPFLGSGTTGRVAIRLGRRFIGSEISKEYYEMAKQRIAEQVLDMQKGERA